VSRDESVDSKDIEYRLEGSDKMSEDQDLIELEQASFSETIQDGLELIMAGFLILFVACIGIDLLFLIVIVSVMLSRNLILETFRKKFTYKRLGQVKLRKHKYDDAQKGVLILFLVTVQTIAFYLILLSPVINELIIWMKWFPAIFGLLFIGPSFYLSSKTGHPRWYLFGIGATILGILFSLIEFTPVLLGWFFYILSIGGVLIIAGCIGFILFIRNNPVIATLEDVDIE